LRSAIGIIVPPYETHAERQLLRRSKRLEGDFTDMQARAVETWGEIIDALILLP
jgi:hypothetical protein